MGFFSNAFKSVSNVAKMTVTTAKTAGYAVTGATVIGVLVVGELVLIPIDEAKKSIATLPQIPARILTFVGADNSTTGVGGHIVGQARFQVITPSLIRLEYAEDGKFEDRPTMLAFNRSVVPPSYQVIDSDKEFTIKTSKVKPLPLTACSGQEFEIGLFIDLIISSLAWNFKFTNIIRKLSIIKFLNS